MYTHTHNLIRPVLYARWTHVQAVVDKDVAVDAEHRVALWALTRERPHNQRLEAAVTGAGARCDEARGSRSLAIGRTLSIISLRPRPISIPTNGNFLKGRHGKEVVV